MSVDIFSSAEVDLDGKSIEELLGFVGDAEQGCKAEALDRLLAMDFAVNYPIFEQAIRNNENANQRNGAMEVLIRFGNQSIPKLFQLLRDSDEEVRNFSAVMLGDVGSREAVGPLIGALRDTDANVRHGAAEALGRIGDRAAFMPLLELLSEDFWLQYPAITALAAMKDERAVPHLLSLLGNEMLTEPVIEALGGIGDPRALVPIGDILNLPGNALSGVAARAIVKIYRQVDDRCRYKDSLRIITPATTLKEIIRKTGIERLKGVIAECPDRETVKAAVLLLGWLQDQTALADFFRLLAVDDYMETVESSILAIGKSAVSELGRALSHPAVNVRIVAIRSVRWLGEPEELHKVVPLLFDPSEQVQFEALSALKEVVSDEMLPRLCHLVEHADEPISSTAIDALGRYPLDKLQDFLQAIIASALPEKRRRAAQLLGHVGKDVSPNVLGFLLKDPDASVRMEALRGAGLLKRPDTLPMLRASLDDLDIGVREEAVNAIAAFGNGALLNEFVHMLGSERESLDYAIVRAIGRIGSADKGRILVLYLENCGIARNIEILIIETLGKIRYQPAVELLMTRYVRHRDPDFRRLAVLVLEELTGVDSVPALKEACSDAHWSVRIAALRALVKIHGDKAVPFLSAALSDSDNMVRKSAIVLLGDIRSPKAVAPLVQQLVDRDMGGCAFESLLKFGRGGLPWLHRVMNGDYHLEVRERVIDLVGKIGDRRSIEPLLELLNDPHGVIRMSAIDSLVFCYDTVPLKRLFHTRRFDPSEEVRCRAEMALGSLTMENFF